MSYDITKDCLYSNFLSLYKDHDFYTKRLYSSGFIDEKRTSIDNLAINDVNLLSFPIKNNDIDSDNLAVIVTTGSFSPIHDGHIKALNLAKDYVEKLGFNVLQGIISLSHDKYVSYKNNGKAKLHIAKRVQLVYEKIKDISWLSVDRFEGELVSCPINFSTVLERIKKIIDFHIDKNITVFYVFGSDNCDFSYSFVNNQYYHSICIERGDYSFNKIKKELNTFKNIHFLSNNFEEKFLSSTKIRENNIIYNNKKNEFKNNIKKIYLIRTDDTNLSFSHQLKQLLQECVNEEVEFRLFNSNDIYENMDNTISLDKYIKGNYSLDISRKFEICGYQNKANGMCSLSRLLEDQIKDIKEGDYILVDDDSVSGYTFDMVTKLLKNHNIDIIGIRTLIRKLIKENEELYDVVDARDFLIGSNYSGLVVSLFNKKNIRVPYIFPFVNLTTRANILPEKQLYFSKEILKYNLNNNSIFSNIDLCNYLSFDSNKEMIDKFLLYFNNYLDSEEK